MLPVRRLKALCEEIRLRALGRFGSDDTLVHEVFRIAETRGAWRDVDLLLRGDGRTLQWARTWTDGHVDSRMVWQSSAHGAPDHRSPLMCALQATPRHAILARLCADNAALHARVQAAPYTLVGLTAAEALQSSSRNLSGDAAREALTTWRMGAVSVLMKFGGRALAQHADFAGRTALHYAAAAGDNVTAKTLLRIGADATAKDSWGRTASHVAAAYCHRNLAEELAAETGVGTAQRDAFGHNVDSILSLQKEALDRRCELGIERCSPPLTDAEFYNDYVALNRPVLIKGGASHLPAMERWATPELFSDVLGGIQLTSGHIPYAREYGLGGAALSTLAEFVAVDKPEEGPQPYVFDVTAALKLPELHLDATLFSAGTRDAHLAYVRQPQLGVGFRNAGAPMHMHHSALNALFAGKKRWWLVPPFASFWSFEPMAGWPSSKLYADLREKGLVFEIVQQAGDLLFVPEGWGHATLLEGDKQGYGVGIGQEFIPNSSIFS